jgi:hypothetical protein
VKPRLLLMSCLLFVLALTARISHIAAAQSIVPPTSGRPFDCNGERCDAVARGFHAFVNRQLPGLDGNGRSCADCHMPGDNFQASPDSVEARCQWLQWRRAWDPNADDPLFRPIDADDSGINGVAANDSGNLRERITHVTAMT